MNTNCLTNIACPRCSHEDSFIIEVKTRANVTDYGAESFGDMFWDERSFIECKNCETGGTVAEFTRETPEQGAHKMNADALAVEIRMIGDLANETRNLKIRALYAQGEALQNSEKPLSFDDYEAIAWNMGFLYALQIAFGAHAEAEIATTLEGIEKQFDSDGPLETDA
jgi:hypothetical protein